MLAATSSACVWPAVILTSAGSHGTLQLDVRVSVQFWSGRFSSPEWFGAVVFKHSPTLSNWTGMGAHGLVAGICQPWGLYSIWGLAGHSGGPWIPQAPTFHLSEAAVKNTNIKTLNGIGFISWEKR